MQVPVVRPSAGRFDTLASGLCLGIGHDACASSQNCFIAGSLLAPVPLAPAAGPSPPVFRFGTGKTQAPVPRVLIAGREFGLPRFSGYQVRAACASLLWGLPLWEWRSDWVQTGVKKRRDGGGCCDFLCFFFGWVFRERDEWKWSVLSLSLSFCFCFFSGGILKRKRDGGGVFVFCVFALFFCVFLCNDPGLGSNWKVFSWIMSIGIEVFLASRERESKGSRVEDLVGRKVRSGRVCFSCFPLSFFSNLFFSAKSNPNTTVDYREALRDSARWGRDKVTCILKPRNPAGSLIQFVRDLVSISRCMEHEGLWQRQSRCLSRGNGGPF